MKQFLVFVAIAALTACSERSPTEPDVNGPACANPAPLVVPQSCANPNAPVDDFIVRLSDGIDYQAEARRLGTKYGFTPETWTLTPNYFGARLTRRNFFAMQCESSVVELRCAHTNIPPP